MGNTINLRIQGSEEQAAAFNDNCRRSEMLFAGTLMNRFRIPVTDENADLVLDWFKSVRDMAIGNWIGSGMKADSYAKPMPRIVCLCGSTRFADAFRQANLEQTVAGHIVLSIGCDMKTLGEVASKADLDELHKRKIDLADEILVLNVGGYIGESTRSEIEYALQNGKPVRWLEDPSDDLCREFGVRPLRDGAEGE